MKSVTIIIKRGIVAFSFFISVISMSQTVISNDNFNSNLGTLWNDGGSKCQRVGSGPINGTGAIELINKSGAASSMYTNNINLSTFGSASIAFEYRTQGFWWGLSFIVEYSSNSGSSWTTIGTYANPAVTDNSNYSDIITIDRNSYTFNSNARFRIRCDAQQDSNKTYIDNVVIKGYAPAPEIDVRGNGYSITDGDTTPWIVDNTDYGSANANIIITRAFTIHNTGTASLTISGVSISNTTDFQILSSPAATVAVGGSTSFSVQFKALTIGLKSTTVTINNNDSDEHPYDFIIRARSEQNFFDSDGDGIFDNVDIDDDNDGILDSEEELACKNSPISITTKYKFLNETFGTGNRAQINTTYDAITTYIYENGTDGGDGIDLNDGKYTVYYKAANGDGTNQTPNGEVASWADEYWYLGTDHTPSDTNGRMAMFNASYEPGLFYTASIKGSLPNVPVTYSFWALNLDRSDAPGIGSRLRPNIKVEFRDVNNNLLTSITTGDIAPTTAGNLAGDWYNFSAELTFNVSEFNVFFINNEIGGLGNDLAIDDIEITQTLCDTDGDGVADVFDLDSDNDGIPDVVEAGLGNLSQGKATLTYTSGWLDANGNGMHDLAEGHIILDSDGDGTPNFIDLDSDNDAIFDVDESGAGNTANASYQNGDGDIDGDGVGDGPDTDAVRKKDFNSDGTVEYFTDGILNIYDFFNGNTLATAYGNSNQGMGNTYFVKDSDNDGIPDYIDLKSDGSTFDISHTLYADMDANNNGRVDGNTDADSDGLLDLFDTDNAVFGSPRDLDKKLHLYFDGRNDYAQDVSVINGWSEASMMTWVKFDNTAFGAQRIMGQDQFYIEMLSNGRVRAYAKGSNYAQSPRLNSNRWIHLAATYSSSGGILKLYMNGEEVGSKVLTGSLPADASLFTLGKRASTNNAYFKGYLDEVRVFNKALSADEIQKMVYQEIENNSGIVKGAIIPRNITNYINPTTIVPLNWSSLQRYYRMDTYKGDVIDNLTTASIDVGSGLRIYNSKYINYQNAPLPFVTNQSGNLDTAITISADGVNGADAITYDWSIVHVKEKNIEFNGDQKHLGLIIDQFDNLSNPITYSINNDSELNVSWYLKLDGTIKLEGESQLVQGDDSELDSTSKGKLEKNQQGTADKFTYNYWSSPVGVMNNSTNNNDYRVRDVMKDGVNNINWLTSGHNGTNTSPIGIADYWIWKYANLPDDSYASWQHVRSTGTMRTGEGYTMKGPGTGSILTDQNYLFSGKPNNGDINLTLNAGNDYLVGNPYPSAIDGEQFILDNGNLIAGNGSTSGALYFWEHWGGGSHNLADYQGGYATYNLSGGTASASFGTNDPDVGTGGTATKIPGRYIPVGQGFFVVAEGTGGTIKFRNSQRFFMKEGPSSVFIRQAAGATTTNYNPDGEDSRMKFRIGFNSINTIHRQLLLTIDSHATDDIDWGYDAKYIDTQMDDMYWMISGEKFNIQGRDVVTETSVVPLGLHLRDGGQNKISIDLLENVPDEMQLFVHDKVLDTYHDLRQNQYEFTLPAGVYLDRYELTFQQGGALLSVGEDEMTALEFFYANSYESLVLVNPTLRDIKAIELYTIIGQSVCKIEHVETKTYSEFKVPNLSTGTYIVKVITETGSTSKKVLVK